VQDLVDRHQQHAAAQALVDRPVGLSAFGRHDGAARSSRGLRGRPVTLAGEGSAHERSADCPTRRSLSPGPTASGKSAFALKLAREIGGEIVNADSMQIYAGLRVLTAGPSPEEMAQAPHHLFGVVDAADGWSVGRWLTAATQALARSPRAAARPSWSAAPVSISAP
jgi:hypothetical protein